MKRLFGTIATLCAACAFCASPASGAETSESDAAAGKVLIAYYSWSGNTRHAAERIQKTTNGTLFEIKPKQAYPKDYAECVSQAKKEIQAGFKPELASDVENFARYEIVFVGTPNWWSTMAPPVLAFLSSHDFKGKTVVPFVTHGSGGMARCETDMRAACPGANFLPGKAFYGNRIQDATPELTQWAKSVVEEAVAKGK